MAQRFLPLPFALDLPGTVAGLRRGPHDPTCRLIDGVFWRASRRPTGPATVRIAIDDDRANAEAWGAGAEAALDHIEDLIGLTDDVSDFAPANGLVAKLWRDFGRRRMPRSGAVTETLIDTILEQRVTTFEAHRSRRDLIARYGEPAPGPIELSLPPDPNLLADVAYYDLHELGIEKKRADAIRRVAASARRLDALASLPPTEATARLLATTGVGPWTAAEVARVAFGDPDAVPVGDVHLPGDVTYALTETAHARDDDAMLEALAPYAGHRGRVISLIAAAGIHAPRRAPRYEPRDDRHS